jgi:glycosyltransferase involved in cell wall biosynthesis
MKAELFRLYSSKLKIVAPSTWLANQAQSSTALTGKNVSVIPNPVSRLPNPGSGSKRNSRVLLGISESAFVVAFSAANLDDKRKGLEELLSQLEVFAQDNPQISIQLLLLGASRRKVSCPGLTVIQRGFVSAYQAKTDLQAADVLVNFSQEENLSMSLIEALSASVPILALDSGGNSDIVQEGKTGFLIESPQILPIRLKQFADSPDLVSKFAREARKDFEERFAADKVAKSYIELYNL